MPNAGGAHGPSPNRHPSPNLAGAMDASIKKTWVWLGIFTGLAIVAMAYLPW